MWKYRITLFELRATASEAVISKFADPGIDEVRLHDLHPRLQSALFYVGVALLFTHELDAMPNHEWRVLPLLRNLADSAGEVAFVLAHIPIFAIVIACIASLNIRTRTMARDITGGFLVLHALLHFAFSGHAAYQFDTVLSSSLIYGAALCGFSYLLARWVDKKSDASE